MLRRIKGSSFTLSKPALARLPTMDLPCSKTQAGQGCVQKKAFMASRHLSSFCRLMTARGREEEGVSETSVRKSRCEFFASLSCPCFSFRDLNMWDVCHPFDILDSAIQLASGPGMPKKAFRSARGTLSERPILAFFFFFKTPIRSVESTVR